MFKKLHIWYLRKKYYIIYKISEYKKKKEKKEDFIYE